MKYASFSRNDYGTSVKMFGRAIPCYSKKQIKAMYPDTPPEIVGEVVEKPKRGFVGEVKISSDKTVRLVASGFHNPLLWSKVGYLPVGDGAFVLLLKSRIPFLAPVFTALVGSLVAACLSIGYLTARPPTVPPLNPLPDKDVSAVPLPDEGGRPDHVEGGLATMVYTRLVELDLSEERFAIHFKNPSYSSHDVSLSLVLLNGEEEILLTHSGLIPSGNGLFELPYYRQASLTPGEYAAKFYVAFYDPLTGERALVESQITDVVLRVSD